MAKPHRLLAAALLAAGMTLGGSTAQASQLTIGAILSLSGDLADFGQPTANAIALAVERINAAGGVLGAPVKVVQADDRSEAAGAREAIHKLVDGDKANALIGPQGNAAYLELEKSPNLAVFSASSTTAAGADGVKARSSALSLVPSDLLQGEALAEVAREKGYRTMGVVHANNDYGKALATTFTKAFTAQGGKVGATVAFTPKQAGDHDEIKKAAEGGAEALLVIAYPGDGAVLVKQALDAGLFNKFLLSDRLKDPAVIEAVGGQFLDGVGGAVASAPENWPAAAHFEAAYSEKFGSFPGYPYLDRAFDAVYLYALAAEKAKSTEPAKINAALKDVTGEDGEVVGPDDFAKAKQLIAQGQKIRYVGAAGPLFSGEKSTAAAAQWKIQDGKIETVRVFTPKS